MQAFPYTLAPSTLPKLGLIVLAADETLEEDMRRIFPPDVARLHVTRIPSDTALNPDTIHAMEAALPLAAALFPATAHFESVGYGCTSGTTLIGEGRMAELVSGAVSTHHVSNPLTATLAAIQTLGIRRLGLVSPYIDTVAGPVKEAFELRDISVPATLSFGEEQEANVARIAPASICDAARALAQEGEIDGIFLSCTNLRTLDIIPKLETELALPVLSSNQTLAWHMAAQAGLLEQANGVGRLWSASAPAP